MSKDSEKKEYVIDKSPECPKCSFRMTSGLLKDNVETGSFVAAEWLVGGRGEGIKIHGYRCESCGFIELYARKD